MVSDARIGAPIKVLFGIDSLIRGGTELQLTGLIERLDRTRIRPYLVTIRPFEAGLVPADCDWIHMDVPKLFRPHGLLATLRLARWLRKERIDVVHTFFQDSTVFVGMAAVLSRVPVRIASLRDLGFWSTRRQRSVMRLAYGMMTCFLCNAEIVRQHFRDRFDLDETRMRVIRNGIDVETLAYVDRDGPTRDIGIIGNMTREVKRTDLFVRAAAIVSEKLPTISWHVVGDGHLRPALEALSEACGIRDRTTFTGQVTDVPAYLEILDVGVICSDSEGLSNAVLEYMCKGTAVIATDVGGNSELIDHEVTGLLIPPNDADALAQAMIRMCADPEFRRSMARNARDMVERSYSWSRCVSDHQSLYEHLAAPT